MSSKAKISMFEKCRETTTTKGRDAAMWPQIPGAALPRNTKENGGISCRPASQRVAKRRRKTALRLA